MPYDVELSGIGHIIETTVVAISSTPVKLNPRADDATPELASGIFVTNPSGDTVKYTLRNHGDAAPTGLDSEVLDIIVTGFDVKKLAAGKNVAVWAWSDGTANVNVMRFAY